MSRKTKNERELNLEHSIFLLKKGQLKKLDIDKEPLKSIFEDFNLILSIGALLEQVSDNEEGFDGKLVGAADFLQRAAEKGIEFVGESHLWITDEESEESGDEAA